MLIIIYLSCTLLFSSLIIYCALGSETPLDKEQFDEDGRYCESNV